MQAEEQAGQRRHSMWVNISSMFTEPYQRGPQESHIRTLARTWRDDSIGVIHVSYHRPGRYAIVDGQQRIEAYKRVLVKRGLNPAAETVWCQVYFDLTYADEARLYVDLNKVKNQSALQRFKGRVEARERAAVDITQVVESFGLAVAKPKNGVGGRETAGTISAIVAVERVYKSGGRDMLSAVLSILHAAYGQERQAYEAGMLDGLDYFLLRWQVDPLYKRRHLVDSLSRTPVGQLDAAHKTNMLGGQCSSTEAWGRAFLLLYNKGLRNKMPSWEDPEVKRRAEMRRQGPRRNLHPNDLSEFLPPEHEAEPDWPEEMPDDERL